MKGILADIHMVSDVVSLVRGMQKEPWTEFWIHLGLDLYRFQDFNLTPTNTDLEIWRTCQLEQLIFVTNNRNEDSSDSLETAIRTLNTPTSLPVFTIGKLGRFQNNREYAERVLKSFFEYLLDIDRVRGAGRLYLP